MRVLTVAADVPFPPVGGARTRNHHLVRALAAKHEVTVLAFDWGGPAGPAPPGVKLRTVPWRAPALHAAAEAGDGDAWRALSDRDAEPFGVSYYASEPMERAVAECGADVVVMTETAMGRFRSCVPDGVPCVLDLHDVHTRKLARDAAEAERMRHFEAGVARECAVTVCVSDTEAEAARRLLGAPRVEVVPNGVDAAYFGAACHLPNPQPTLRKGPGPFLSPQPNPQPTLRKGPGPFLRDAIVFTGSLHTASNIEAVSWLVREVLPLVPRAALHIVGASPTGEVLALAGPRVRVHGSVDDVREHLRAAAVAVVPIRHGGGTRLKLLEAAAAGRAIVTTTVGMEGLDFVPGRDLLLADEPDAFAAAIESLCADPARRAELGAAARAAAAPYDWGVVGARWRRVIEAVA